MPRRSLGQFQSIHLQEKPIVTVITPNEVTVQRLIAVVVESGLSPIQLDDLQFRLRTESGIGFRVSIEEERQFVRIHTYLPTAKAKSRQEKLEFTLQLNAEIFLPTFSLDADDDVLVNYVMPYQYGLIVETLVALVYRFGSMLSYVVDSFDTVGMFDFTITPVASGTSVDAQTIEAPLVTDGSTVLH